MRRLIITVVDICLLRRGPQDLPAGVVLAFMLVLTHLGSGLLVTHLLGAGEGALQETAFYSLVMIGFVYFLLRWRGLGKRLPQTLAALAGAGTLMNLISLPMIPEVVAAAEAERAIAGPVALGWLVLFFWSLVVDGHIFRHALSVSFSLGVLVATVLFAIAFVFERMLFGVAA